MITRPFQLEARVSKPAGGLDLVPFLDVVVILLFFGLLGSRFILSPGVAVNLRLPTMLGAPTDALPTSRVLTIGEVAGSEMVIFEDRILNMVSLERLFTEREGAFADEVLLVRIDRDVSMVLLVRLCDLAKRAGFSQILLAAEPEPAVPAGGGGG